MALDLTFRAASTNADNTFAVTAFVVTKPTGTADGDLIFIQLANTCLNPCTVATITPPAGFNLIRSDFIINLGSGAIDVRWSFYWKIASSEPASWTFTGSSANAYNSTALSYQNPAAAPFQTSSFATISATTAFTAATLTTDQSNELLIMGGGADVALTFTPPTGMTERSDANSEELADVIQALAAATGTKSATASTSASGGAWLFSFYSASSVLPGITKTFMSLGVGN